MSSRLTLHPAYARLSIGARSFATLILGLSLSLSASPTALLALVALASVWFAATVADRLLLPWSVAVVTEGAAVAVICSLSFDTAPLLAALAFPPFTAGLRAGLRGVATSLLAQLAVVVTLTAGVHGPLPSEWLTNALTWAVAGLGLGFIARYLHAGLLEPDADPLKAYREAQALIRGLLELSGDLGSGLDPDTPGHRIAVEVRNALPISAVAVYVSRGDQLTPLVTGSSSGSVDQAQLDAMAARAWHEETIQIKGHLFAMPLRTDAGVVGVVSGMLPGTTDPGALGLAERLDELSRALTSTAVHLDTALLFSRLRDAATADERRRLAREMHDGVAQDIASLGYLVDALSAAPASPDQAEGLRRLREQITSVVAQVRLSVQTLRTDVEASESLGTAISGLARHLSDSSEIPIRVTVNERTTRLRPEVESELLRITQEAMTNAVRHAQASVIDVNCRVAAPVAEIVVRDDGKGWGQARPDSYGLAIMRERANLIDADLEIEPGNSRGTVVTVRLPSRHVGASRTGDADPAKVSP